MLHLLIELFINLLSSQKHDKDNVSMALIPSTIMFHAGILYHWIILLCQMECILLAEFQEWCYKFLSFVNAGANSESRKKKKVSHGNSSERFDP